VDLATALCHELLSKPVALVYAEGNMRTFDKASMLQALSEKVVCLGQHFPNRGNTFNEQAMAQAKQ